MLIDRTMVDAYRLRTSRGPGIDLLLDSWNGVPADTRAARLLAGGDVQLASAYGGGWKLLAEGDVVGALREARGSRSGAPAMKLLEAEAFLAAGGIVAGLDRLEALHNAGEPVFTLALARRRHLLGDYIGAEEAAAALPHHAQAALIGARAALASDRPAAAFHFIEAFLDGCAPIPEPMVAGAIAVVAASIMARRGQFDALRRFAKDLLGAAVLPDEMMPTVARVAWIGGLAAEAWELFGANSPWMAAARLELAVLAGDAALASRWLKRAGALGIQSAPAVLLLQGGLEEEAGRVRMNQAVEQMFGAGVTVHVWRTHPHRWSPWINAALRVPADVKVFDLARGETPDAGTIPHVVLDDGSLVELLQPVSVPARPLTGDGVWIGSPLCRGIGVGRDWPDEETRAIRSSASLAADRESAAVWVLGADTAFEGARQGRRIVAVAPPGDPFWAGSLPERSWPSLRIVRADARTGWVGAGARAVEAVESLLAMEDGRDAGN